jgi:hypothetical protein
MTNDICSTKLVEGNIAQGRSPKPAVPHHHLDVAKGIAVDVRNGDINESPNKTVAEMCLCWADRKKAFRRRSCQHCGINISADKRAVDGSDPGRR